MFSFLYNSSKSAIHLATYRGGRILAVSVKKIFDSILEETKNDVAHYIKNPGHDMTRNRICDFSSIIKLVCSFTAKRTNTELLDFFHSQKKAVPTKSALTQQRKKNKYKQYPARDKILSKNKKFSFIPVDDLETVYDITFRAVCVKLDNGEYEYLITNLPADRFPASEIKKLYHMRWGIETSFRTLKYAISLANLHSVNRELIIQEIYAKLIVYNFASLLHRYAEKDFKYSSGKGIKYKASFEDAIPLVRLLLVQRVADKIIKTLLQRHRTTIQTASQPRIVQSQRVKPLNNRA